MTFDGELYSTMVVLAFTLFTGVIATVCWLENRPGPATRASKLTFDLPHGRGETVRRAG